MFTEASVDVCVRLCSGVFENARLERNVLGRNTYLAPRCCAKIATPCVTL